MTDDNQKPESSQDQETQLRRAFQKARQDEILSPKETSETPDIDNTKNEKNCRVDHDPQNISDDDYDPETLFKTFLHLQGLSYNLLDKFSQEIQVGDKRSEKENLWINTLIKASFNIPKNDYLTKRITDKESFWEQKVSHQGENIGAGRPRFGSSQGGVISGESALLKTSAALGLGGMVQIPLWRSGFWVTIKAPSESSLLELERRISMEKVKFGRATGGMLFSNTGVYVVSYAINFALQHIYTSSLKDNSPENLKAKIKTPDIPILLWGLACVIHPKGYPYSRPCTSDPIECRHIVHGNLDLGKMCFTDTKALTDWQKRQMMRRNDKFTDEEIAHYQSEHTKGTDTRVQINDILSVVFHIPNVKEYENSGFNWVDGIYNMLETSLGTSLRGDQRSSYITEQAKLTALQQYSHWVKEIQVDDDVIQDRYTLEELMGTLTASEEIMEKFYEEIKKFIDQSVLSVIAIPRYQCPACGGKQKADVWENFHPHLLPIDMVTVFFILLHHKVQKSISKETTMD